MSVRAVDVALPLPVQSTFTYRIPEHLSVPERGARVVAPFGPRRVIGVVTGAAKADVAEGRELKEDKNLAKLVDWWEKEGKPNEDIDLPPIKEARLHYLPFRDNPHAQALPEFDRSGNVHGSQMRYQSKADGSSPCRKNTVGSSS